MQVGVQDKKRCSLLHCEPQGNTGSKGVLASAWNGSNETFAHVANFTTIRCILALEATLNLEIYQIDVKTMFLLEEDIYME